MINLYNKYYMLLKYSKVKRKISKISYRTTCSWSVRIDCRAIDVSSFPSNEKLNKEKTFYNYRVNEPPSWSLKKVRIRRPELFCKKGVLKKFTKFIGKHLLESHFNKVASNFIKIRLQHRCFPVNFVKFLRTTF